MVARIATCNKWKWVMYIIVEEFWPTPLCRYILSLEHSMVSSWNILLMFLSLHVIVQTLTKPLQPFNFCFSRWIHRLLMHNPTIVKYKVSNSLPELFGFLYQPQNHHTITTKIYLCLVSPENIFPTLMKIIKRFLTDVNQTFVLVLVTRALFLPWITFFPSVCLLFQSRTQKETSNNKNNKFYFKHLSKHPRILHKSTVE